MLWLKSALVSVAALLTATASAGNVELLDFTASWCGPCRQMAPVVHDLAAQGYPVRAIDIDQHPDLAQRFGVSAVPCFVVVRDGREVDRIEGGTAAQELVAMLERHGAGPRGREVRGQSPDEQPMAGLPRTYANDASPADGYVAEQDAVAAQFAGQGVAASSTDSDLIASSVRLRISDPGGNSVGSGTIIDARDGEALVLTCGHVFRDSQGKGTILVDTFGPGAEQGLEARLVDYNLDRDIGLVSFHTAAPLRAAKLAPMGRAMQAGEECVSVGCDHGRDATAIRSRVTSIDKFQGPPNLQVAGQPVQGRSGGGLFSADGLLIGVCNAADPQDNEGLYAGHLSIHAELERTGLSQVLFADGAYAQSQALAGVSSPDMPAAMPRDGSRLPPPSAAVPTSSPGGESEVICIIRSRTTGASSEVIVIDEPSADLLRQISTSGRRR